MFTGIIKAIGSVQELRLRGGDMRLRISADGICWEGLDRGDSVAVNGVCLTANELHVDGFDADLSNETLSVTALGNLVTGSRVNLEPALSLGQALGGHFVSGHVDCVGTVVECTRDARSIGLRIGVPNAYSRYLARKGSVCVDGVSLTINAVSHDAFEVNIIPHTAEKTIVDGYRKGTRVNIEVDMLARYIERLMQTDDNGISESFLRAHGYG